MWVYTERSSSRTLSHFSFIILKAYNLQGVLATAIRVFYFSLQVLFTTRFWPINFYPDTLKMCPEMCVDLHIEYPLFSSRLNQNCKVTNKNIKNSRASDLMKCFQHCSVVCVQTYRQIYGECNSVLFMIVIPLC